MRHKPPACASGVLHAEARRCTRRILDAQRAARVFVLCRVETWGPCFHARWYDVTNCQPDDAKGLLVKLYDMQLCGLVQILCRLRTENAHFTICNMHVHELVTTSWSSCDSWFKSARPIGGVRPLSWWRRAVVFGRSLVRELSDPAKRDPPLSFKRA